MNTLKFNQIEFNHIGEQPASSVKLQDKTLTITENCSSEVKADNGYDGLSKVKVNVNVNSIIYFTDPEGENLLLAMLGMASYFPVLVKVKHNESGEISFYNAYLIYTSDEYSPIAYCADLKSVSLIETFITFEKFMTDVGLPIESLPLITKEQFYDLSTE